MVPIYLNLAQLGSIVHLALNLIENPAVAPIWPSDMLNSGLHNQFTFNYTIKNKQKQVSELDIYGICITEIPKFSLYGMFVHFVQIKSSGCEEMIT